MEHSAKIIIGANYGDEGKGLVTRHFAVQAKREGKSPITVLHNGTAQRGHTVDYNPEFRHVFHHFGSGTLDQVPSFFADSFLVHPMSFIDEYLELSRCGRMPRIYCDPGCVVITPFDMLIDHAIEADIAVKNGEREYGSCGYGSWSATDRIDMFPEYAYTVRDFLNPERFPELMDDIWKWVVFRAELFRLNLDAIPFYGRYFAKDSACRAAMLRHFAADLRFFLTHVTLTGFDGIWNRFDCPIFENGQGLGLDKDVPYEWHTTSKTGLANPVRLLQGRRDFSAEVIYVTRSYLTRHGVGRLEEEVRKKDINADMHDATNVPNEFQGSLRYGYLEDREQRQRIAEDWKLAEGLGKVEKSIATTHCNEFCEVRNDSRYFSDSPYSLRERIS
ncbi:MAG: adenylosuccinate synthetase [Oscillospiraceae bacterium]|nr:adenylosuccinate synthetase [Oscillospiraceae bacterium]MBR3474359.1 adenylosuccinate synthetase [Oscillospiraceae bacterium]